MRQFFRGSAAALRRVRRRFALSIEVNRCEDGPLAVRGVAVREVPDEVAAPRLEHHDHGIANGSAIARASARSIGVGLDAAQFAHDLDNLLMVIASRTALARIAADRGESCAPSLLAIETATRQAQDLSKLLRDGGTRSRVSKTPVDFAETVQAALTSSRPWMPSNVALVEDIPPDAAIWILGNRTQLQRVIHNLLANAIQAMTVGGKIIVSLETTPVRSAKPHRGMAMPIGFGPKRVCLNITDNGVGMDANARARIFEPGFSQRCEGSGRGLGMTIVGNIVRDHRGSVEVESSLGRGTRVCITFPISATGHGENGYA
ncbi:MAG: hypothetical protein GXP29_04075 [Planctomycetes bacterium]|nr:hypothetical protein [Planctomycetota bacterium]